MASTHRGTSAGAATKHFLRSFAGAVTIYRREILSNSLIRSMLIAVGITALFCILFTVVYVEQETPTWFWDYANYHEKFKESLDQAGKGLVPFLGFIGKNVQTSQHNITPVLPLLPARILLGSGRVSYIVSLILFYLIPAAVITTLLSRIAWCESWKRTSFIAVSIYSLLFVPYWAPTLRGHPDIICVLPLAGASLLLIRCGYLRSASVKKSILIGLLLWSAFLLRRHTLFTVAAIIATTFIFGAGSLLRSRKASNRKLQARTLLINGFCMSLATVLPALIFQHEYIKEIMDESYSSTFGAYREGFFRQISEVYGYFGLLFTASVAGGAIFALFRKAWGILYCLTIPLLAFLAFQHTQSPSEQHLLIFSLFLFPASCLPFILIGNLSNSWASRSLTIASVILPLVAFSYTFPLYGSPLFSEQSGRYGLLSARRYPPLRLKSYQEVKRLTEDLKKIIKSESTNTQIAVLASSDQINIHIIRALGRKTLRDHLMGVSDVDLRDAFQLKLLDADYVVASTKPAVHLGERHQRVIAVPSKALHEPGNPLYLAYEKLAGKEYLLSDGTKAAIFKRRYPVSAKEVEWLQVQFQNFYPSWERSKAHIGRPRGGY